MSAHYSKPLARLEKCDSDVATTKMNKVTTFSTYAGLNLLAFLVLAFCFGWVRTLWRHPDIYPSLIALTFFILLPTATFVTHRFGSCLAGLTQRDKVLLRLSLAVSWGVWISGSLWYTLFMIGIKTGLWGITPS